MAFMTGSSVKLRDSLKDPLSAIGGASQGRLQDVLGRITAQGQAGQMASGRPTGQYMGQMMGQANTLASRGIDDSLYGVIGNASYGQDRADRDHIRQMALAKKLGGMMKPNAMSEILSGIGSLGKLIPAGTSLYNAMGSQPQLPTWAMGGYGSNEWDGLF